MPALPPTFTDLRGRYAYDSADDDEPPTVSLSAALSSGDDPLRIIAYLRTLRVAVASLDDLHAAIADLPDEEELSAFRCQEGIAVSVASDGQWLLFTA